MKILLIIALIFTCLTALAAIVPPLCDRNDPDNAMFDGCFTMVFLIIAGIFYALWGVSMLIHYLLN